jgi:hypothetical protein
MALAAAVICSPLIADVPSVPKPPPFDTAATSFADVAEPMPPRTMG